MVKANENFEISSAKVIDKRQKNTNAVSRDSIEEEVKNLRNRGRGYSIEMISSIISNVATDRTL